MFTGIVESQGVVGRVEQEGSNQHFHIEAAISNELKIDQSVAHNGVCLTVVGVGKDSYKVTAIEETLRVTNLGEWQLGTRINLERCMAANGRFDGHIVQGHVDTTAQVESNENREGSWLFRFALNKPHEGLIVPKGSICVNGVSLTVTDVEAQSFAVAVIPYTYEHTNLGLLQRGSRVNIEFDILGKYVKANLVRPA